MANNCSDPDTVRPLKTEVRLDYARAMNKLAFDSLATRFPATYDGVVPVPAPERSPVPVEVAPGGEGFDISAATEKFRSQAFMTHPDVVACLASVHAECAKVAAMTLFNTNLTKSVRLDEFQLMQTQAADYVHGYLRNTWGTVCRQTVVGGLQGVGKGWFNLGESSQEVYDVSKLKKFMRMVKYIMEDALYSLVQVPSPRVRSPLILFLGISFPFLFFLHSGLPDCSDRSRRACSRLCSRRCPHCLLSLRAGPGPGC
jgi:dynein heavy chain